MDDLVLVTFMPGASAGVERNRARFWSNAMAGRNYAIRDRLQEKFFEIYSTKLIGRLKDVVFYEEDKYEKLESELNRLHMHPRFIKEYVQGLKHEESRGYLNHRNSIDRVVIEYFGVEEEIAGYMLRSVGQLYPVDSFDMTSLNIQKYRNKLIMANVKTIDNEYSGFTKLGTISLVGLAVFPEYPKNLNTS